MNKFEFKRFKDWFFSQKERIEIDKNKNVKKIPIPYYQLSSRNNCVRECGRGRNYNKSSWKYFTIHGNKNFIINGDYIEFDTPVDENGNTYNRHDSCLMFYGKRTEGYYDIIRMPDGSWGRGEYHKTPEHHGDYKHIRIHYKKFCYPLSNPKKFPFVKEIFWQL